MTTGFNIAAKIGHESALLARIGVTLYGEHWQERIAHELGVSGRSVRYWLAGRRAIPVGVWRDLRKLAIARQIEIAGLLDELSFWP